MPMDSQQGGRRRFDMMDRLEDNVGPSPFEPEVAKVSNLPGQPLTGGIGALIQGLIEGYADIAKPWFGYDPMQEIDARAESGAAAGLNPGHQPDMEVDADYETFMPEDAGGALAGPPAPPDVSPAAGHIGGVRGYEPGKPAPGSEELPPDALKAFLEAVMAGKAQR